MRCKAGQRASRGLRPRHWVRRRGEWYSLVRGCKVLNLWYQPWRGFKVTDLITFRGSEVVNVVNFPRLEFSMKRRNVGKQGSSSGAPHLAPVESNIFTGHAQIVAHCAVTRYDDGEPRTPGWVTIKTLGSAWICEAKDPDACAKVTATGDSLDNALTLLDLLLGSEDAPWEPDPWLKRRGKPEKK